MKLKIIAVIFVILIVFSPFLHRAFLSAVVAHDILPQTQTKWMNYFSRPPLVEHPTIPVGNIGMDADLYRPDDARKHAAIVYVRGANDLGKDDPRLVDLAQLFARAGFVVLVPGLPDISPGKVNPDVIPQIQAAIEYIHSRADIVQTDHIGVLGFSVGSGPMLIAVSRLENSIPLRFVISYGGYYDLKEEIVFATTGHFSYQGVDHFLEPDSQNRWFFVRYYSDFLRSPMDSALLKIIAQLKTADPEADVSTLVEQLAPEGRAVYDSMVNTDPAKTGVLIESLPEQLKIFIEELNPTEQVRELPGDLYIVHNTNDNVISYDQSLKLYDHFKDKVPTHLFLFKLSSHVNPEFSLQTPRTFFTEFIPNIVKFWLLNYEVLGYGNLFA